MDNMGSHSGLPGAALRMGICQGAVAALARGSWNISNPVFGFMDRVCQPHAIRPKPCSPVAVTDNIEGSWTGTSRSDETIPQLVGLFGIFDARGVPVSGPPTEPLRAVPVSATESHVTIGV